MPDRFRLLAQWVFLIQNAQNRDTKAPHLKLDELIRGVQGARTRLVSLEQCSDEELEALDAEFQRLRRRITDGERDESSGPDAGADSSRPSASPISIEVSSKCRPARTSGGPA